MKHSSIWLVRGHGNNSYQHENDIFALQLLYNEIEFQLLLINSHFCWKENQMKTKQFKAERISSDNYVIISLADYWPYNYTNRWNCSAIKSVNLALAVRFQIPNLFDRLLSVSNSSASSIQHLINTFVQNLVLLISVFGASIFNRFIFF